MEETNELVLMVGLPRSGKSTIARAEADAGRAAIVNPDSIRLAIHGQRFSEEAEDYVWAVARTMVRALFGAGHKRVIIDATNTTRKRRDFWKPRTKQGKAEWRRTFLLVQTSAEVCKQRAGLGTDREDTEIVPVIDRMAASFEPLHEDEVFGCRVGSA